jgi:hypothetical protein
VRETGDAFAPAARGGGCRFTPSMYGGPRGAADAGLFLRLPLAAFSALLTEGRGMQVGGGHWQGPEPLAIVRAGLPLRPHAFPVVGRGRRGLGREAAVGESGGEGGARRRSGFGGKTRKEDSEDGSQRLGGFI